MDLVCCWRSIATALSGDVQHVALTATMPSQKTRARAALGALIGLMVLPNALWLINGVGPRQWDGALVVPFLLLLFFFALFGRRLWLACLILSPFALLAPLECFYVATYRHPTSAEVIGTLVATNPGETISYLNTLLLPLILALIAGLSLALIAALLCYKTHLRWSNRWREWVVASGLILPVAVFVAGAVVEQGSLQNRAANGLRTLESLGSPVDDGYPFGTLLRFWTYHTEWEAMHAAYAKLDDFRFHATSRTVIHERQVYVLVVGESSRRNHWQLFGYPRPTNPELMNTRNLVPISDVIASWPESVMAIPMLLTRKSLTDTSLVGHEAAILRAMQEAGYETWWISNQLAMGQYDSPVSTYAMEAQHLVFINHASWRDDGNYDEGLLRPLQEALSGTPDKNLFIVLHMMGSHQLYDQRYPSAFRRFTPVIADSDSKGSAETRIVNSYDNTILYTDHVLARIIDTLNKSGAVTALWFESDHGETLPTPTCSLSGHGIGTRYDYMVPALFWYSDAYGTRFPERVAQLRENAHQRALSASTFESLIDMAGVDFPGHDETWSLFSSQWTYHARIVNGFWTTDFDKAQFGKGCEVVIRANNQGP
jgi:glucan phosphoethanolaminetransferase (alkaline phosphatase superfamily)